MKLSKGGYVVLGALYLLIAVLVVTGLAYDKSVYLALALVASSLAVGAYKLTKRR